VPTWFYGHEPPNVFAGQIAKFFSNALREDLLLVAVTAGVVYLPGAAGTVQELFQAATPGYYSPDGGVPLVLLGREHWSRRLPAWELLTALAGDRGLAERIHLLDDEDDVAAVLAVLPVTRRRP
jgi:predicted Rossmann-fold nucleotide-binding protein